MNIKITKYKETVYSGDKLAVEVSVKDYLGNIVTNATVKIELVKDGKVAKSVTATHVGGGVYTAEVNTGGLEGDYALRITAMQKVGIGILKRSVEISVTILPLWQKYLPYIAVVIVVVIVIIIVVIIRKRRKEEAEETESLEEEGG